MRNKESLVYLNRKIRFRGVMLALGLLFVAASHSLADSTPPQISMNSAFIQNDPGNIAAVVLDDTDVSDVTLYYRKPGDAYYNSIDMERQNDIYSRNLNRELGVEGSVEYFILAQDTSGNQATEPRIDPETNPLRAAMNGSVNESARGVSMSNPEPGAMLETGTEPIMITFYNTGHEIDFNSVRLKVDRRDRTREAEFVGNMLLWEPRRALTDGVHEIEVVVRDTNGDLVGPNMWSFTVQTQRQLPLGAEGNFYIGIQRDDRSKDTGTVPLWNNRVDLGLRGEKGGLKWSAGVLLSSEETSFLTSEDLAPRQPVNRYYLDARTDHFNFRFGDSNPNFSELSLKGVLVRGVNLAFDSNRFDAQFVKGYNRRDIEEDVYIVEKNVIPVAGDPDSYIDEDGQTRTLTAYQEIMQDPVTAQFHVYEFQPGTFRRDVTALQMDVTPIRNKLASWTLGFNFFSAEDDSSSLSYQYDTAQEARMYSYGDALFATNYKPQKNWVGTVETAFRFNNDQSILTAEFGGTLVTENMFGKVTEDIEDELPDDIDDDVFRFNGSTQTSFDKQKLSESVGKGISDAITSVYLMRLTTPIPVPKLPTTFKGEVYRIPTHYVSLGNPQQKTDIGGYKFDVRTRLLEDQVTLNLGMNSYSDNLDHERQQYSTVDPLTGYGDGGKDLTKDTDVANVSVNLRPNILTDYAPTLTVGYRTYTASNNLDLSVAANNASNLVDTSTNTVMVNLGGVFPVGEQRHAASISLSNMDITDDRPLDDYLLNESKNMTVMLNVNSTINPLPLSVTTTLGHTGNRSYRTEYDAANLPTGRNEMDTGIMMFNMAGTYKWLADKRLRTTLGFGYLGSSNDETGQYAVDNTKLSFKLQADYNLRSSLTVGGLVRFITYTDNADSSQDYTEPIIGVNLRSTF